MTSEWAELAIHEFQHLCKTLIYERSRDLPICREKRQEKSFWQLEMRTEDKRTRGAESAEFGWNPTLCHVDADDLNRHPEPTIPHTTQQTRTKLTGKEPLALKCFNKSRFDHYNFYFYICLARKRNTYVCKLMIQWPSSPRRTLLLHITSCESCV